jgi:poly-gamma-glutamate synthase PgsB/CapB
VLCEELAGLLADVEASALPDDVRADLAARATATLAGVVRDDGIFPRAAEAAAAGIEAIARERAHDRRALTRALAAEITRIPAGGRRAFSIKRWSPALQAALRHREGLGRVLADLARQDWGLDVRVRGNRVVVWRGDRFRRRAWRVLHELRNPAPNKRQAFRHTVGRAYQGAVRAHPGNLDEATATTVPGERVAVDSEGTWCRHLPLVDDLLDLPLRGGSVDVASSFGTARIHAPPTLWGRLRARAVLSRRYRAWANLRLASLRATEPRERRRYLEAAAQELGIRTEFLPLRDDAAALALHGSVETLFPTSAARALPAGPVALATLGPLAAAREWLSANSYYFESATENSQRALTLFITGLASVFVVRGYQKRRQIEAARAAVPLTIGGWGTRGKSGTERLKAAMFDGLGYNVFVKTTGCEAMFIHSAPLQKPVEIFIYRPYDKATIWEQMAMIRLASRLHADVFMWECMALNPKYVQLLQHDWMRDDLVTLTNSYPDHEDIQGPVGFNVAQVITEFIPKRSTLITSEMQYLPLFADRARARGTTMHAITDRDAELISDEVLDLFPYREHPRNIALVGRMAEELGLERTYAQMLMAANVVPDLGVLKAYPRCRVRGRYLTFVCGNSANERTGFINNWRRMKCDQLSMTEAPTRLVVTVVNNRADRVSRSEVFARILVRDVAFDRHVLIGTNLKGLRGFLNVALADYLAEVQLVVSEDFAAAEPATMPLARLDRELSNLRIPPATVEALWCRLDSIARHADLDAAPARAALEAAIGRLLADPGTATSLAELRRLVDSDGALTAALDGLTPPSQVPSGADLDPPESVEPATKADALDHVRFEIARVVLRARLERAVRAVADGRQAAAAASFQATFVAAYTEAFWSQIVVIDDAGASGDQIIDRCARAVPPGSDVILMGTQNIKGTGLDFVYRWLALDAVVLGISQLHGSRLDDRGPALTELEAFADHGLVDAGYARVALARPISPPLSPDQEAARQRILAKCQAVYERRKAGLTAAKQAGWQQKVAAYVEGAVDYLDSIHRTKAAGRIIDDLVAMRISHNRASIEMRDLVGRLKGGWLYKGVQKRLARRGR